MAQKIIDTFKELEKLQGLLEHVPELSRRSAILIPIICPKEDWEKNYLDINRWKIVFTIRSAHLKEHAGEVSFPGGRIDTGETPQETALREAKEEIGLQPSNIIFTFKLNDSFARSGYHIVPFCSLIINEYNLSFSEDEVSHVVPLSVGELLKIKSFSEERSLAHLKRRVWHYPISIDGIGDIDIWGATGNILRDILLRIEALINKLE